MEHDPSKSWIQSYVASHQSLYRYQRTVFYENNKPVDDEDTIEKDSEFARCMHRGRKTLTYDMIGVGELDSGNRMHVRRWTRTRWWVQGEERAADGISGACSMTVCRLSQHSLRALGLNIVDPLRSRPKE